VTLITDLAEARSQQRTLVDWLPWLARERHRRPLIVGTVSAWDQSERHRYSDRSAFLRIGRQRWGGMWPGELARPYAMASWREGGGRARGPARPKLDPFDIPLPSFCDLSDREWRRDRWVCVDLTQAYWSIARPLGMDVRVRPETGVIAVGSVPWADQPTLALRELKLTQAMIVSTARVVKWQQRDGTRKKGGPGWWFQPQLWAAVALTLQAVALEAVQAGARAVICPDAYVIPEDRLDDLLGLLGDRWGLTAKIQWRAGLVDETRPRVFVAPPYRAARHTRLIRLSATIRERLARSRQS
jgi:hypothetical protein